MDGWMDNSFFSVLLSTTASRVSCLQPITEPAFLISLLSLLVLLAPMLLPQKTTDLQHLAAHIEGSQHPQEVANSLVTYMEATVKTKSI